MLEMYYKQKRTFKKYASTKNFYGKFTGYSGYRVLSAVINRKQKWFFVERFGYFSFF